MAGGAPAWWQPFQSRAAQSDLPCQAAWARKGEPASADDDALVAEVSDQFEVSPERFHVSGQATDRGAVDLAVLDLADSGRGASHLLGDLPLCQPPGPAYLGELVSADLGQELILQLADLLLVPRREQLPLDIGPLVSGHASDSFSRSGSSSCQVGRCACQA